MLILFLFLGIPIGLIVVTVPFHPYARVYVPRMARQIDRGLQILRRDGAWLLPLALLLVPLGLLSPLISPMKWITTGGSLLQPASSEILPGIGVARTLLWCLVAHVWYRRAEQKPTDLVSTFRSFPWVRALGLAAILVPCNLVAWFLPVMGLFVGFFWVGAPVLLIRRDRGPLDAIWASAELGRRRASAILILYILAAGISLALSLSLMISIELFRSFLPRIELSLLGSWYSIISVGLELVMASGFASWSQTEDANSERYTAVPRRAYVEGD